MIQKQLLISGKKYIVLYGGETHSAVLQTFLDLQDLLAHTATIYIVIDATSSYNTHDRNVALARMRDSGAKLTTFQSLVFELERTYEHPMAKQILAIVKDQPEEPLDLVEAPVQRK